MARREAGDSELSRRIGRRGRPPHDRTTRIVDADAHVAHRAGVVDISDGAGNAASLSETRAHVCADSRCGLHVTRVRVGAIVCRALPWDATGTLVEVPSRRRPPCFVRVKTHDIDAREESRNRICSVGSRRPGGDRIAAARGEDSRVDVFDRGTIGVGDRPGDGTGRRQLHVDGIGVVT